MDTEPEAGDESQPGPGSQGRREFLARAALGAALASVGAAAACRVAAPTEDQSAQSSHPSDWGSRRFELEETSIPALQAGLVQGRWTSRQLVDLYLDRIKDIDRRGPTLRSIIEINPDASAVADQLDAERREGRARGILHGIPIVIKDNIDTGDRMKTTAGSLALADSVAPRDAFVVERLRQAGAIILGKTNLSEWANFRSTRSTSGWSARGGQCRNPYVLDRNPCGSSSGSGVAAAASLAAAAVGTETDGSIVCPSNNCALVGIKPTVGLISRAGIIPISVSQDTAGPMARTVTDAALLLGAMTGVDPRDPATAASQGHALTDYAGSLDERGLAGARLGIARAFFDVGTGTADAMVAALEVLREQGAVLIDPVELPPESALRDPELTVLLHEFKAGLNAYLATLGPSVATRTLEALIAFNEREAEREMPYFGQELFVRAQATTGLEAKEYLEALATGRRVARVEGLDATMATHRLDALVAPTGGPAWTIDLVNGDHFTGGSSTFAAVSGYPAVTVPAGWVRGLPVGLTFFGRAWSEPTLIRLAFAFEQATSHRKPPRFVRTLGV
jgi:amidase